MSELDLQHRGQVLNILQPFSFHANPLQSDVSVHRAAHIPIDGANVEACTSKEVQLEDNHLYSTLSPPNTLLIDAEIAAHTCIILLLYNDIIVSYKRDKPGNNTVSEYFEFNCVDHMTDFIQSDRMEAL